MHSAADEVRRAIDARGGAIRFDEFMSVVLYGEHGFYTRAEKPGRAGRRGDFITSPEVGSLFGAVISRALDQWWDELGRPDPFVVVDAGAGPGTLARSVLTAQGECSSALRYIAVEISAAQRAMHPDGVESRAEMPPAGFCGVILANELLDNLPFRLMVFDDGWREAHVAVEGNRFVELLHPVPAIPRCLPTTATHGSRVAVQDTAASWVTCALDSLSAGRVVSIDYCTTTTSMAARPWREWLRTYAAHGRGAHYLSVPGDQDITVEVALDQLPEPLSVTTQADFLSRFGIETLVDEGRSRWSQASSAPDLAAMTMRSRVREAEALLDRTGLGGFSVLEWRR